MICIDCRGGHHTGCRGGTWCDCQHRATSNRWGQWLEGARLPHEVSCAHMVMYPAPCDCKPLELDVLMELAQVTQEDGLGDHARPDL